MRGQQTAAGGEDGALAVAFDGASFEHEVEMVLAGGGVGITIQHAEQLRVDGIIQPGLEFLAPSVEAEIQQANLSSLLFPLNQTDKAVVAGPGVVGLALEIVDALGLFLRQSFGKQCLYGIGLRMDDEQRFARRYGIRHLDVGLGYLVQHRLPVGISVRPGELYKSLWFPFGGHSPFFHAGKVTHK